MLKLKRSTSVGVVMAILGLGVLVASYESLLAGKAPQAKKAQTATKTKAANAKTSAQEDKNMDASTLAATDRAAELQKATFGTGCFWCSEAVFQQLKGVYSVVSGYSGGLIKNPTYHEVCSGQTGHAEVIQVSFDPQEITYPELLEVFWKTHDPTTLNRQGADIGTQYRSVIFYHSQEQKQLAEHYKKELEAEHAFRNPIVTEIAEFSEFYPAEDYHQDYYNLHKGQDYCTAVIGPKISKMKKVFHDKLKQP